jgi:hypothetical protein
MPVSLANLETTKAELTDFSVVTGASGQTALSYVNTTGVFTLTPVLSLTDLNITDGTSGQFLMTDGSGNFAFNTMGAPLTALSVTQNAAGTAALTYDNVTGVFTYTPPDLSTLIELTDLQVLTAAAGTAALTYNNTNGEFIFTPPDVSSYIALTDLSITTATAGTAALTYDNATGVFTFTPEDISAKIELTDLSITTATAGTAALTYDNATGVFTYTPPDLSSYLTAETTTSLAYTAGTQTLTFTDETGTATNINLSHLLDDTNIITSVNTKTGAVVLGLLDLSITDGTSGQILSTDGAGNFSFVDDVVGIGLSDLSITTATAGTAALAYDNATGVFTYTPPDLSSYLTAESDTLATITARGATTTTAVTVQDISVTGTMNISGPSRNALTVANSGSFDMDGNNHFSCTPTGNITLTFTNIADGQSGNIYFDNSGGHTISKAASVKSASTTLTTLSTPGIYWISYFSNGTDVLLSNSASLT